MYLSLCIEHSWSSVLCMYKLCFLWNWIKFLEAKVRLCSSLYALKYIICCFYLEVTKYVLNSVIYLYRWTILLECIELGICGGKNTDFTWKQWKTVGLMKRGDLTMGSVQFCSCHRLLCTQPVLRFHHFHSQYRVLQNYHSWSHQGWLW